MKKDNSHLKRKYKHIPTKLTEEQFNEFILPHLSTPKRGPKNKLPLYQIFDFVLQVLHTGMQWMNLPIPVDQNGKAIIHYTRIFKIYRRWTKDGSLKKAFENSVLRLKKTVY